MQKNEPLISIVVANYNNAQFVQRCLTSILDSYYKVIQLIIIDDASTDQSVEIITNTIADIKVDVSFVCLKKNLGSGNAKQKGLDMVKGEYCCFVDSDDYIHPEAITKTISILSSDSEIAMVYTNAIKINDGGVNNGVLNYACHGESMLTTRSAFHLAVWKMDSYNKLTEKFNPKLNIAYDIDLYMKLEEVGKLYFLNEPLYYYRIHENNISIGFNKLGYSLSEMIMAKYDCQRRRNLIDSKKLGLELQLQIERITKHELNNSKKRGIIYLVKKKVKALFN